MAHSRKDTYVASPQWAKHLRPIGKRKINKRERLAAKTRISKDIKNNP